MPIYEYKCEECGHQLEALQKISDAPLTTCPSCNNEALKKKVSAAAFRLKGGGWYETDYKSGNKKNLATADKGSDGNKSDSKKDGGSSANSSSASNGSSSSAGNKAESSK